MFWMSLLLSAQPHRREGGNLENIAILIALMKWTNELQGDEHIHHLFLVLKWY